MEKNLKLVFKSWLSSFDGPSGAATAKNAKKKSAAKAGTGFVYFLGVDDGNKVGALIKEHSLSWQNDSLKKNEKDVIYFVGSSGPVWILRSRKRNQAGHTGLLDESDYAWARDQFGGLVSHFRVHQLANVALEFHGTEADQELGALTGFEIASYAFRTFREGKNISDLPAVTMKKSLGVFNSEIVKEAQRRGKAVNLARHLVNMPPNELHPQSFAQLLKTGLGLPASVKVDIWNQARLVKEGMGLHAGVGQGSDSAPCMVHLSYRPRKKSRKAPIAFVGKGITFDTGGLDIKPSSGMRLMKKDMGGAACVIATALWVAESAYERSCDFYLALAENSIDAKAFRPSDILTARNGMKVEIDNTDAEGRLVLADCLDVAVTQKGKDEPEIVIDVATLTGAIKVGLGAEIAGLFSNDDDLAESLTRAGQRAGDLNWRMPLFDKYFSSLSSPFADFKNSGDSFGGAITAALFLQKFVRGKKWAHLDVYAWTDRAQGALLSTGGNGQPVQCLIEFLQSQV